MTVDIFPTTAESIISATDAVLSKADGCDETYVSEFMDIPLPNAKNALGMAKELGLISIDTNSIYRSIYPLSIYLVTARETQKASVMRLILENYLPFKTFKYRLLITNNASTAADQIKVIYSCPQHREEIKDTLINLGTFSQSLISEGGGNFKIANYDPSSSNFIQSVSEIATDNSVAEIEIRKILGMEVFEWLDFENVVSPLITAHLELKSGVPRSPIVHAGNAVESFLIQIGNYYTISLSGANGINSKVDRFSNNQISTKHKFMFKYLGHIRNAADHGTDPEIGTTWTITPECATEYVNIAIISVRALVKVILNIGYSL